MNDILITSHVVSFQWPLFNQLQDPPINKSQTLTSFDWQKKYYLAHTVSIPCSLRLLSITLIGKYNGGLEVHNNEELVIPRIANIH